MKRLLRNIKLQTKAVTLIGITLFCVIGINTAVLTAVAYSKYKDAVIAKNMSVGEGIQKEIDKVLSLGVGLDTMSGLNERLGDIVKRDSSIGYAMITDTAAKVVFHGDAEKIGSQAKDQAPDDAKAMTEPSVRAGGGYYDIAFPLRSADDHVVNILRIGVKAQHVNNQLYRLLFWALGVSVVCFLVSVAFIHVALAKFVTRPFIEMERTADTIASGDLRSELSVTGRDEVGALQKAINRITFNLKEMISKIAAMAKSVSEVTSNIGQASQHVVQVADVQKRAVENTASAVEEMDNAISKISVSTENLSESIADTSSSVIEMGAQIERIAENANFFNETAHETAASIEEMVTIIKQIAANLESLTASSEAIGSSVDAVNRTTVDIEKRAVQSVDSAEAVMRNASERGMGAARSALEGMDEIRRNVFSLSEVINTLGKRTQDIGKILSVIDDVADQTNLLALNAAILASKAGEHGKGFSVVADEIKSLAERTSFSTKEISELITSVQDDMKASMRMSTSSIQTVERGLELVNDVNQALREIVDSSRASTEMAKEIQEATTEEAHAVKQITDAVENMTRQTESISRALQEQTKGSQFIIEATEKMKELSQQVKTATSEQRDGSRQLNQVIENITLQTSQISNAIVSQRDKSIEIIQSMEKILNSADTLISSANDMGTVIGALKKDAVGLLDEMKRFKF